MVFMGVLLSHCGDCRRAQAILTHIASFSDKTECMPLACLRPEKSLGGKYGGADVLNFFI